METNKAQKNIERLVLKAVAHFTILRKFGTTFRNIYKYVRTLNRNSKSAHNLSSIVTKSLENYQKLGLVNRDKKSRYKLIRQEVVYMPSNQQAATENTQLTEPSSSNSPNERDIDPNSRKRKCSDQSLYEENPGNCYKRFRSQKNMNDRKGRQVNLPRVTRATNQYLLFCCTPPTSVIIPLYRSVQCKNYANNSSTSSSID